MKNALLQHPALREYFLVFLLFLLSFLLLFGCPSSPAHPLNVDVLSGSVLSPLLFSTIPMGNICFLGIICHSHVEDTQISISNSDFPSEPSFSSIYFIHLLIC